MRVKQVQTPDGVFPSSKAVAEHYGMTLRGVRKKIRKPWSSWHYVVDGIVQIIEQTATMTKEAAPRKRKVPPLSVAEKKYRSHKLGAGYRGISFQMTFEEWWNWWQVDGRWENRGNKKGQFVMARRGDQGPYRLDNVYCATTSQNTLEMIALQGAGPTPRQIWTPDGVFKDALAVAAHFQVHRNTVQYRVTSKNHPWRYHT